MKQISTAVVLVLLFGAQIAFAQSVYPTYYPPQTAYQQPYSANYGGQCLTITRDLTVGSRGADVLQLQQFILTRNYPGAGSWMLTSYFGKATRAGVINFQIDMHLPQTGILDAQTRGALSQATCGYNNIAPIPNIAPAPYTNNYSNQYPLNTITQPWYNLPTGQAGYNNYTYGNNYNGNCSSVYGASPCTSSLGQCGTYSVTGYNNCGTSNTTGGMNVSYLSPASGGVGTSVTVYGTGFSSTDNSILFGNGVIANLNSYDGRSVTFTVPSTLSGYGYSTVTQGTYNVSVTNASGFTSNAVPFVVNSYGTNGNYNAPSITNVSGPTTLNVNTTGTWLISVNNQYGSTYTSVSVNWGDAYNYGVSPSATQQVYGSQSSTFTHSYSEAGTYTVLFTVTNSYGSNTSSVTVQVGGSNYGTPTISYVTPNSGAVGTSVTVYGTGFSSTNNTVSFGSGLVSGVSSYNGSSLSFVVPSTLSGYGYSQVTPGIYNITVSNSSGAISNTVPFTVNSNGNGNANAPTITNVSGPTTLNVNTTGTWSVSVNNPYSSNTSGNTTATVSWGDPVYGAYLPAPLQITGTSQTVTFTHAYSQSGTYTITFTVSNSNGSNTSTQTVQVGGNSTSGTPSISYIAPTYGSVGQQIEIVGSGFNGDNIVHFGNGGQAHVTSASGNYLYYTVPSTITPCTVQVNGNTGCPQYAQQVTPGQYQIYITTNGNNSNSLTFTVQ